LKNVIKILADIANISKHIWRATYRIY